MRLLKGQGSFRGPRPPNPVTDGKPVPGIKPGIQDNYDVALREAWQRLSSLNLKEVAEKSGAHVTQDGGPAKISVRFLDSLIIAEPSSGTLKYSANDEEIPPWLRILTLHYLINARGTGETGTQITYKQIEGGLAYYPVFQKRTVGPLSKVFGEDFGSFVRCGETMGGKPASFGDYSLQFQAFPRVSITYVIWKGDDEFPVEGNVMFDSSITDYLSSEDITILCNMVAVLIIKSFYRDKPAH